MRWRRVTSDYYYTFQTRIQGLASSSSLLSLSDWLVGSFGSHVQRGTLSVWNTVDEYSPRGTVPTCTNSPDEVTCNGTANKPRTWWWMSRYTLKYFRHQLVFISLATQTNRGALLLLLLLLSLVVLPGNVSLFLRS